MDVGALTAKAETLQQLIDAPELLVLPNIWDVAGTRIVENEGFPVIATSSAGIAWSLGYPDGENISREDMLFVAARIAASTQLPVTADLEAGYGEDPEAVAATVEAALDAGIVGANIEDSSPGLSGHPLLDFTLAVERIHAGREAADSIGVPFVINARTDGFFGDDNAIDETVRRGNAFMEAGAGCVFVPFVRNAETIGELVRAIDGPVNILASARSPDLKQLQDLGVARVSIGGLFTLVACTRMRSACRELQQTGTYGWAENVILHPEMNAMMAGKQSWG